MKTIFWNVDTQYDFMRPDGKLPVKDANLIEPNLKKLTEFAEKNNYQVVNTADWHNSKSEEISDNPNYRTTFPQHCMIRTEGAEFIQATKPKDPYMIDWQDDKIDPYELQTRNIVLYKDKFDIFTGSKHANKVLEILNPDKAVVYGVATNVCVDYAINGLLDRKIKVYIPTDAIKELPNLQLEEILRNWERKGAILTTTEEITR